MSWGRGGRRETKFEIRNSKPEKSKVADKIGSDKRAGQAPPLQGEKEGAAVRAPTGAEGEERRRER